MRTKLMMLLAILVLSLPPSPSLAGGKTGAAAETDFSSWITTYGGTHYDFENLTWGSYLSSLSGVSFQGILDPYGNAISLPVLVSGFNGNYSHPYEIVGTPYASGSDDGRVVYEMTFDTPQRWAAVARQWYIPGTVTKFYNEAGDLIYQYGSGEGTGWARYFIGYLADDTSHWIKKIVCDGVDLGDYNRQVGYTDDLYFGTADVTTTYSRYDFTYYYNNGNGDTYTGSVYAATGYNGYAVNYTQASTDENSQAGYYEITAATDLGSDGSKAGQVYVTSYYDKESGNTYTPVSNGSAVGTSYFTSEHDYIILSGIPEFYFGGGYYEADVGSYSRFDFTFNYNNGSGDYYTGYVYAPTSFETSQGGFLSVGTYLYIQPQPLWASGYHSLNGAAYYITAITDGYASSYDKESYITSYYDSDTAGTSLGVNSDGSATAGTVYVADRSTSWESGYALSGSQHDTFSVYKEADVTLSASAPPSPAAYSQSAASQAVWAAYWSQTPNLLEEEK